MLIGSRVEIWTSCTDTFSFLCETRFRTLTGWWGSDLVCLGGSWFVAGRWFLKVVPQEVLGPKGSFYEYTRSLKPPARLESKLGPRQPSWETPCVALSLCAGLSWFILSCCLHHSAASHGTVLASSWLGRSLGRRNLPTHNTRDILQLPTQPRGKAS